MTECKEVIRQTLATINNFNQTKINIEINPTIQINSNTNANNDLAFDHQNITLKLIKGQWVDVKDTIDQWLEAQVIDVQGNKAYVHYNGWGNRWDEWIDMTSNRIKPFR